MSDPTPSKRPANEETILSGREKRRVKNRDARRIDNQNTFSTSKQMEGDHASLATARLQEISGLQRSIRNAGYAINTLSFQALPHSLRRRAASHDVKRLPMYLRAKAAEEMAQSPPTKKKLKRRLPLVKRGTTVQEYLRRQRDKRWLETHVWHAKRMKMVDTWGYRLALHNNNKSGRTNYRAFSHHCMLHDASYESCLELTGDTNHITTMLDTIMDPVLPSVGSSRFVHGHRAGHTFLYEADGYPTKLICTVLFLWQAEEPMNSQKRKLWIWIHPSAREKATATIKNVMLSTKLSQDMHLVDRCCELQRFELSGARATALLQSILEPAMENEQANLWRDLRSLRSSGSLPPGVVIGLHVRDPRVRFPQKVPPRTNQISLEDDARIKQRLKDWPRHAAVSDIWKEDIRAQLRRPPTLPTGDPNAMEIDAGSVTSIPILLIQRGSLLTSSEWTTGKPLTSAEWAERWSLVVPAGWGNAFWKSAVFAGAWTSGLKDVRAIEFESGFPSFPYDFPGTSAFEQTRKQLKEMACSVWERTPPAKRVNYQRAGISHPFDAPFETVIHGQSPYWLLQGSPLITAALSSGSDDLINTHLKAKVLSLAKGRSIQPSFDWRCAVVKIRLLFTDRSKPVPNAMVYLLEEEHDYERYIVHKNRQQCTVPNPAKKETHRLIGYLTNGGFSLSMGCGFGIGACSVQGLRRMHEVDKSQARKESSMVLVRNPNCRVYRPARIEILS